MGFQRKAGFPLYLQIKEDLLARIESGQWQEKAMIPTERMLCEQYGASTITVREALKLLVHENRLRRIPGKGTFVTAPKLEHVLPRYFSFTRWAEQNGLHPTSRIMRVEVQRADRNIRRWLQLPDGDQVTHIDRLRLGSGEPLMLEDVWVACDLCPGLHLKDLANFPLNDIITGDYRLPLVRAVESIEPSLADDYTGKLLEMSSPPLILLVEHTTFTLDDRPVLFARSRYRGDRYKFSIELTSS